MRENLILVVDDDEANRYAKCRMLRQAGFSVTEAASGEKALQIVATDRPAVVCLDVRLPDISGFEVCRRIKTDPALRTMVLQMSASFVGQEDKVRGLEGGADGYLVSPVEPAEFLATVRSLLRIQQAEEALRESARQWRVTFDAISNGILLVDGQGCVLRCNRAMADIIGKPFEAIVGRPYADVAPFAKEKTAVHFTSPSTSRQEATMQIGARWFEVALHPATDNGTSQGAVCVVTDITDRSRQEEEIRQLNASLQERVQELQQSRLELQEKVNDLEQFEDVVVGRELKMMELEKEIARLKQERTQNDPSRHRPFAATE